MSRSSRQGARREAAAPLAGARIYGPYTPVSITLTLRRGGSEPWIEVRNSSGRFFVNYDASVIDLMQQLIAGGHWHEVSTTRQAKRGKSHA